MKRFTLFAFLAVIGVAALAGTFYDRTYFAGDVAPYAWTAPTNFASAPTSGGAYTNGTATNYYRIAGTNACGRTPLASATGIIAGAVSASNAYALTWTRRDGVTGYWIERSPDAATWTQHVALAAGATNYTDSSNALWTAGAATPTGTISAATGYLPLAWVTNAGTAAAANLAGGFCPDGGVVQWFDNAYTAAQDRVGVLLFATDDSLGSVMPLTDASLLIDPVWGCGWGSAITNSTTDFVHASGAGIADGSIGQSSNLMPVIFLLGQSNASGYAPITNGVYHLTNRVYGAVFGGSVDYTTETPALAWGASLYPFETNRSWGVELTSASNLLSAAAGRMYAVCKVACGGTVLATNWADSGNMRTNFVYEWGKGSNYIASRGYTPVPAAVWWIHGESDATYGGDPATNYYDNASNLFAFIAASVGSNSILPTAIVRLSNLQLASNLFSAANYGLVTNAQWQLSTNAWSLGLVDTDDLAIRDSAHYTADSLAVIGSNLAARTASTLTSYGEHNGAVTAKTVNAWAMSADQWADRSGRLIYDPVVQGVMNDLVRTNTTGLQTLTGPLSASYFNAGYITIGGVYTGNAVRVTNVYAWAAEISNQTASTLVEVKGSHTARYAAFAATGVGNSGSLWMLQRGSGYTGSFCEYTNAGVSQIYSAFQPLVIGTYGNVPIVIGVNDKQAMRIIDGAITNSVADVVCTGNVSAVTHKIGSGYLARSGSGLVWVEGGVTNTLDADVAAP